jgi:hypothetical protein
MYILTEFSLLMYREEMTSPSWMEQLTKKLASPSAHTNSKIDAIIVVSRTQSLPDAHMVAL